MSSPPTIPPSYPFSSSSFHLNRPNFIPPNSTSITSSTGNNNLIDERKDWYGAPIGGRKLSMLGNELELSVVTPPEFDQDDDGVEEKEGEGGNEEEVGMILGSPPNQSTNYWNYPSFSNSTTTGTRSRSQSFTMKEVSPPPISFIARSLQKTPPPGIGRQFQFGVGSEGGGDGWSGLDSSRDRDSEIKREIGVVRRPVARKPNLLPKSKSHLRVLSDLQKESLPADSLEIASEFTLHRLSKSGPSSIPRPIPQSLSSALLESRPTSSSGPTNSISKPTPNRFPESVNTEEEEEQTRLSDSNSLEDFIEEETEVESELAMSIGYLTDEEERKRKDIWSLRASNSNRASPGTTNSPSSFPRPGNNKRKMQEDRFDNFKRRAVSPAGSPSISGSPLLSFLTNTPSLPLNHLSLQSQSQSFMTSNTQPIQIPSLSSHLFPSNPIFASTSSYNNNPNSINGGGSPAPSSLSSSAGKSNHHQAFISELFSGRVEREEKLNFGSGSNGNGGRMGEAGDGIGRMNLG